MLRLALLILEWIWYNFVGFKDRDPSLIQQRRLQPIKQLLYC